MTIEQCKQVMPKWLGEPMYFGGFPIRPEQVSFEGSTMQDIYWRHSGVDPVTFGMALPDDENLLIAFTLYYIQAPIFDSISEIEEIIQLRKAASEISSFEQLWQLCSEFGINPF